MPWRTALLPEHIRLLDARSPQSDIIWLRHALLAEFPDLTVTRANQVIRQWIMHTERLKADGNALRTSDAR